MAFSYSPKIVTDGLVLYLDAANSYSYVSGSTAWNDISRGGNNGTLVNGPVYSGTSGGSIVFDGTNDYFDLGNNSVFLTPTIFSIGMWFNADDITTEQALWGTTPPYTAGYTVSIYNSKLIFQGYTANQFFGLGYAMQSNTWYYMVYIFNSGASTFYVNGLLYGSNAGTNIFTIPTGPTQIARYVGSVYGSFKGKISQIQYYNRALSSQEVLQNYNATKSRFGLT